MKKLFFIYFVFLSVDGNAQTLRDTINFLKQYSHSYLEFLFNKRNIDSAMSFWSRGMTQELKMDYFNHKQTCNTDSTLKVLFANDINSFCSRVNGKIDFFACDDKEGINIVYLANDNGPYYFFINYDFFGDFESHNRLMRTFLNFQSYDRGKTWHLVQDNWIENYMILNYFKKDYQGNKLDK